GSFFENGVTVNTFAVSDAMGNTSSCSFSLTVVDAPLILINSIMHDVNSQGVGSILITVIGSGGYTFAWTKNGQPYSNVEDLTGLSAGVYGLVLSDSNGCTAAIPPILISNFVGQENPGLAPVIRLMPNPATDLLYLEVSNTQLESVSICDMRGAVLRDMHAEEWSRGIFVGQLPAGMYVLKARLSDGRLWVEKWMKK
ncbi:MAG: T9SS type A sorting domain-containing protein, partial [Saprospiraceae bacterium]|nr:T9SS type A sorting domain-containing protein [Saprospiraceae bacterium]